MESIFSVSQNRDLMLIARLCFIFSWYILDIICLDFNSIRVPRYSLKSYWKLIHRINWVPCSNLISLGALPCLCLMKIIKHWCWVSWYLKSSTLSIHLFLFHLVPFSNICWFKSFMLDNLTRYFFKGSSTQRCWVCFCVRMSNEQLNRSISTHGSSLKYTRANAGFFLCEGLIYLSSWDIINTELSLIFWLKGHIGLLFSLKRKFLGSSSGFIYHWTLSWQKNSFHRFRSRCWLLDKRSSSTFIHTRLSFTNLFNQRIDILITCIILNRNGLLTLVSYI